MLFRIASLLAIHNRCTSVITDASKSLVTYYEFFLLERSVGGHNSATLITYSYYIIQQFNRFTYAGHRRQAVIFMLNAQYIVVAILP